MAAIFFHNDINICNKSLVPRIQCIPFSVLAGSLSDVFLNVTKFFQFCFSLSFAVSLSYYENQLIFIFLLFIVKHCEVLQSECIKSYDNNHHILIFILNKFRYQLLKHLFWNIGIGQLLQRITGDAIYRPILHRFCSHQPIKIYAGLIPV